MTLVGDGADGSLQLRPTSLVPKRCANRRRDERTATTRPDTLVEFGNDVVLQRYVHTHVPTLTH